MPAFNVLYRPWVNSFRRMNRLLSNPENASWAFDNHTAGIRVVHGAVPEKMTRFEHRAPGPDVNPYLTVASMVHGCIRGIRAGNDPPPYAKGDAMLEKHWPLLPRSLSDAVAAFRDSRAAQESFGAAFVEHLSYVKQEEWKDFTGAVGEGARDLSKGPVTAWELKRYFSHA
jgi:glutamine synthetase